MIERMRAYSLHNGRIFFHRLFVIRVMITFVSELRLSRNQPGTSGTLAIAFDVLAMTASGSASDTCINHVKPLASRPVWNSPLWAKIHASRIRLITSSCSSSRFFAVEASVIAASSRSDFSFSQWIARSFATFHEERRCRQYSTEHLPFSLISKGVTHFVLQVRQAASCEFVLIRSELRQKVWQRRFETYQPRP